MTPPDRVAGLRRDEVADLAGVNADYYAHLHRLAGAAPACRPATDRISPALRRLLDGFSDAPAFVINATLDILAANPLAEALHAPFAQADNLARMVFLDPAGRHFSTDWTSTARSTAAHLRQTAGATPNDPRLPSLIRTLTAHSPDFARLWTTHEVLGKTQDTKHLHHSTAGPLTVTYQSFDVRAAPGQQLVVYQPAPGTPTAEALVRLRTVIR